MHLRNNSQLHKTRIYKDMKNQIKVARLYEKFCIYV